MTSFDACVCLATEVPQNEVLEFEPTGLEKSAETLLNRNSLSFHVSRAVLHLLWIRLTTIDSDNQK